MKKISALCGLALLLLAGCGLLVNSDEPTIQQEDFFPLKLGQQWTYRITEADLDTSRVGFPRRFTVSVVDERTVEGKKYYLVANYFVPGPSLPDTILVRSTGSKVFVRFGPEQEEHLFYSFTPADTVWNVPMYVNASTLYPRTAHLVALSDSAAAISWDLSGYPDPPFIPGRTESAWGETFRGRIGRTEIVSVSQVFGKVVWRLEKTL